VTEPKGPVEKPRASAWRGWAGNLLLLAVSVGLVLAACEAAARWERAHRKGGKEQRTRLLYTDYDPLLGWIKRPGARAVFDRREYTVEVAVNSHGLRDKERDYAAAPGTFRVLALGDSFIEGFSVAFPDSVGQVLERSLAGAGCPVEVLNGGTQGYSTDQEYLFYREEGARYAPQVVVLFFYYNDILYNGADNNLHIPKPLLTFKQGEPVVANYPVPRRPPERPADAAPAPAGGSAALEWLEERLERSAPRAHQRLASLGFWPPIRQLPIAGEFRAYMKRPPPEIERGWDMSDQIVSALASEVWRHDARLMIAYIPSRMEVNDHDWELTQLRYGIGEERWSRGAVLARLGEIARLRRIPLLDLTSALRKEAGLLGGPYYEFDSHWNALGHRIAARELAGFLHRQGWLPACAAARPELRAAR
jgi:lysophospholipase L1-like esterase